ncbi:MAG: MOSC domain-containing protein, partial [Candidatus Hydrogenedentes bacterium]|nr:MOSC domain-containing protein [Candidatus Hydrogenedentota bacterium]
KIRSVNLSGLTQIMHRGELVSTGIFKKPVEDAVAVGRCQIAGDKQADLVNHGGVDKAVYGYPWEHYAHWAAELGKDDFTVGQFGENLTTEGVLESELSIGDRLRIGSVVLEVSQPRQPCFKLGVAMKLPCFPKLFMKSGLVGFYFRVLEEGTLQQGDAITLVPTDQERVTVQEINHLRFFDNRNLPEIERVLANTALSASWRKAFEDFLANRR